MATEYKIIRWKRGTESAFIPGNLLPGEGYVSTDTGSIYICYSAGLIKKLASIEDVQQLLNTSPEAWAALQQLIAELQEETVLTGLLSDIVEAKSDISTLQAQVTSINNTIGDVALSTTAQTLKGAVNELDLEIINKAEQADVNTINVNVANNTSAISSLESQVSGLASGSPKGVYSTVSDLTTAYPSGNDNIYIVSTDGNWYYWNGTAWIPGGLYQNNASVSAIDNRTLGIIENGAPNSDFSGGITSWGILNATSSITNNVNTITGNGGANYFYIQATTTFDMIANHKYYSHFKFKANNPTTAQSFQLIPLGGQSPTVNNIPIQDDYISFINAASGTGHIVIRFRTQYADAASQSGKSFDLSYVTFIDLSQFFGIGTEPTVEEMDEIMKYFPNEWFSGKAKLNEMQKSILRNLFIAIRKANEIVSPIKTDFIKNVSNLFNIANPSDTNVYYSSKTSANKSAMTGGYVTNKIYVKNGDTLSFLFQPQYYASSFGCLFDEDGNYLESITAENGVTFSDGSASSGTVVNVLNPIYAMYTINNAEASYIELNVWNQYINIFMCLLNNNYSEIYYPFQYSFMHPLLENERSQLMDNFKYIFNSAICIGDSLTEGNYGTGVGIKPKNYPYYLKKMASLELVENAGISGATPSSWWTAKQNSYDYTDYDLAIVFLGTNGTMTDTVEEDTSTNPYANTDTGNYCNIVNTIRMQNPNCKIFLITRFGNAGSSATINTNNAIHDIAEKYDCDIIDLYTYNFYKNNSIWHPVDDVHFGKIGYLILANEIVRQMVNTIYNNQAKFNDND